MHGTQLSFFLKWRLSVFGNELFIYSIYTHTHTYIYIYIYIYMKSLFAKTDNFFYIFKNHVFYSVLFIFT